MTYRKMANLLKTFTFLMAIGLLAWGCQKPTDRCGLPDAPTSSGISYTVDGELMQAFPCNADQVDAFFAGLLELARQGHSVVVHKRGDYDPSTDSKEAIVFSTDDDKEAIAWAEKMTNNGYNVSISYDESNGTYQCVAFLKIAPVSLFSPIGKWQFHDTVDEIVMGKVIRNIDNYQLEFFDNDSARFYYAYSWQTMYPEEVSINVMGTYEVLYDTRKVIIHLDPYELNGNIRENVEYHFIFNEIADIMILPERDFNSNGRVYFPSLTFHRVDDWE